MSQLHRVWILLLCVLGCAPLSFTFAKEAPPAPSAPRVVKLPAPERFKLQNGVEVTLVHFGAVPKVSISAIVRTGDIDNQGKRWLPDLVADLMKEGTQLRSSADIANSAAAMGGELGVASGDDTSSVGLDILSERSVDAIRLIGEVLMQPLLPESELPRLKQDYLRGLSVQRSQAQALASVAFSELIYGAHPYANTLPTEEMIQGYGIDDIRSFYRSNFGARRTHIYVVGQFERKAIEATIREVFSSWDAGPEPTRLPASASTGAKLKLIERPNSPQSTLMLGLPVIDATHPDFMALSVMNTVLGGSLTSRITSNIRENKGWAYSPSASVGTHYRTATWAQSADVSSAHSGAAIAEILKEIATLQASPPSTAELDAAKNYRNGLFVLSTSTRGGLLAQYAFMNLQGLPDDWLSTFVQRMYAVTPQQVSDAASKYLSPEKMSLVIVGDLKTVKPQLETVPQLKTFTVEK